ncbi:hypothetical protein GE061_005613 [Apolygus lucorum]|uniref:Reverse transcriptase domain-containing protein n=1 Tax=Apolygus lucorum TaxID=248454 RepID=A0A8S9WZE4_APOLU|nr:hypothetical protein GE061_005613 [Apolygus lucorum]
MVDICCVSSEFLESVYEFKVGRQTYSDHMPVVLGLKDGMNSPETVLPLIPRLAWNAAGREKYTRRLAEVASLDVDWPTRTEDAASALIEMIVGAAKHASMRTARPLEARQPWWDWDCSRARDRSFALLHLFHNTGSNLVRTAYVKANSHYKKLCEVKRKEYYLALVARFKEITEASDFWKLVRSLKSGSQRRMGDIHMSEWVAHFRGQWSNRSPSLELVIGGLGSEKMDKDFTMVELKLVLDRAKESKAPGPDRVAYEFYKNAPDALLERLLSLFNRIHTTGEVPEGFASAIIFPLFKKGDVNDVANYRGLSFINCMSKLLCALLLLRLEAHIGEGSTLNECQNGFRKGYSTTDAIFTLSSLVHLRLALGRGKKLYAFFIDFRAAFDGIQHGHLFQKLCHLNVGHSFLKILQTNCKHWRDANINSHGG